MRSKFVTDLDDPSDRFLNLDGDQIYALFSLPTVKDHGTPSGNGPVNTPAASPALVSEAVQSSSAQSGTITTTSLTSGGITINLNSMRRPWQRLRASGRVSSRRRRF